MISPAMPDDRPREEFRTPQAYESRRRTNPRSAPSLLWGFEISVPLGDVETMPCGGVRDRSPCGFFSVPLRITRLKADCRPR